MLTDKVKDELLSIHPSSLAIRAAETAGILRYSAHLERTSHGVEIIAELFEKAVAQRLVRYLHDLYHCQPVLKVLSPGSATKQTIYQVQVKHNAEYVLRCLNLVTAHGHPVVGMPRQIVSGDITAVEAAWRGAFLARGTLGEPSRTAALEVVAPCAEAALALVGLARRLGITAKTKQTRGVEKAQIRDADAVGVLLSRIGAPFLRLEWDEKNRQKELSQKSSQRLATFDDANSRRSAQAAALASQRVERAMEILGDDVPEHLAEAGFLRIENRDASLEELGRLADPPMTKDAVAGRIRRLLSLADKRAKELSIPGTRES